MGVKGIAEGRFAKDFLPRFPVLLYCDNWKWGESYKGAMWGEGDQRGLPES